MPPAELLSVAHSSATLLATHAGVLLLLSEGSQWYLALYTVEIIKCSADFMKS